MEKNVSFSKSLQFTASPNYSKYVTIQTDPNGGAKYISFDWQKVRIALCESEQIALIDEFIERTFSETDQVASLVCGIIENGAHELPDMFEWLIQKHPSLSVKVGSLVNKQQTNAMRFSEYYERVMDTCEAGTYRMGPMDALSMVGKKKEECGDYFREYLKEMDRHKITGNMMPWGALSHYEAMNPKISDDGPIFWSRPGEQYFNTDEVNRAISNDKPLETPGGRRKNARREIFFSDRTPAHADFVQDGVVRECTGAVGILRGIKTPEERKSSPNDNRILKDIVCFSAKDMDNVVSLMQIDLYEPPMSQCTTWIDEGKLNQLRRFGVNYAHIQLKEDTIYFLPRKVIHQFRTVAACSTIAWHIRLKQYYQNEQYLDLAGISSANDNKDEMIAEHFKTSASEKGRPSAFTTFEHIDWSKEP
uniref:JmjC domain-containing protein n=1 Tax=Rhabditophanes sp. KR3021 TaxID=114890 RepID=A0AC35TL55_9BILA